MLIKRLPFNSVGRDFVCGDIHGSYSCVKRFLDEIAFDYEKDRLICSGDLVDRGPENEKCLALIYEPWFHMTIGNHEQLMVGWFKGEWPGNLAWESNGGRWGMGYKKEMSDAGMFIRDAIQDLADLPYLITVEKQNGDSAFHVFHAELRVQQEVSDEDFTDPEIFALLAQQKVSVIDDTDTITWGRYRFSRLYRKAATALDIRKMQRQAELEGLAEMYGPDLSMIYSGHTPVQVPTQFYGQTNLDTMAYATYSSSPPEWAGLTITEPKTGKFWLANDSTFKESKPLIISGEHIVS